MTGLVAGLEELIDRLHWLTGKRPLPRHAIPRSRHEINFVPNTTPDRELRWDLIGKDVRELPGEFVNRIA